MNNNINCFKAWYTILPNITINYIFVDNKLRKSFDECFETTPHELDFFTWFKFVNKDLNNIPSRMEVINHFNKYYEII